MRAHSGTSAWPVRLEGTGRNGQRDDLTRDFRYGPCSLQSRGSPLARGVLADVPRRERRGQAEDCHGRRGAALRISGLIVVNRQRRATPQRQIWQVGPTLRGLPEAGTHLAIIVGPDVPEEDATAEDDRDREERESLVGSQPYQMTLRKVSTFLPSGQLTAR